MSYILSVKDSKGTNTEIEIDSQKGLTNTVKSLQEKVSALEYRQIKTSSTARLPHAIGEKVYSSIPLDIYGYINFDGRKIYSYGEFGDFYNHIKSIFHTLNEERYTYQLEKNYDLIGDPTDVYGTISNFAHNSRYARAKKVIKFSDYNAWRCEFYIKMGPEVLSNKIYHFIGRENATYVNGLLFRVEKSKFYVWHKNLNGTYVGQEGKTVLAPNTEYLVRITFLNGKLILSTKVINVEGAIDQYFKEFEVDSQNYPDSYMRFGDDYNSDAIMNGEVDLNRMRFYDLSNEDLSDLDIFFESAPCFYKPSEMLETWSKQGFVPESVYENELEKFGCSGKYVLNEEEQYVRIPLHKDRQLIVNQTYSDGSWLRVYDDGYCEQSGFTHPNGSDNVETLWFHQPMKDTNYQVFVNMQWPSSGTASWQYFCAKNLTTKTFQVMRQASYKSNYEIKGYVNLDEVPEDLKNVPQDNFEYLVVANGVQNIVLDRNDELKVNNPFTLLESKYSRTKLNNISWLRYEGEELSKEKYPSVWKYLLEQRSILDTKLNWENREDQTDFDQEPEDPTIIVKLKSEEHTENDYVIDQENNTFTLPVKSESSYTSELEKVDAIIHNSTTDGVSLKIYASGYVEQEGTLNLTTEQSEEINTVNFIVPIKDSVIFIPNGLVTERTNTSFSLTNVEGEISYRVSGFTTPEIVEQYKPEYRANDLYLYYFMGDTVTNLSLIDAGKLQEELLEDKEYFKTYGNVLKEVQGHTTKFSKTIAKTQVSKAVEDLVKQIKLRDVYTENMNENFLLPDPYFEGSKISFKGYNFAIFADSFKMFDEYSKRLYLLDIRYSEHYSELADENGDYNLSFDVYFTYDKRKELKTNVINPWSGDVTNLPDYDSKARLRIKVYGENTINELNTPDGGENVYSGYVTHSINNAPAPNDWWVDHYDSSNENLPLDHIGEYFSGYSVSNVRKIRSDITQYNKLSVVPEQVMISNIHNRHISELPKLFRSESATNLPLGEMELTFSGLRVSKVQSNIRNAPYGYFSSSAFISNRSLSFYYGRGGVAGAKVGNISVEQGKVNLSLKDGSICGPFITQTKTYTYSNEGHHNSTRCTAFLTDSKLPSVQSDSSGSYVYLDDPKTPFQIYNITVNDGIVSTKGVNSKPFAQRMSEFSMTVMNRYGSKTIIYDKTNVDQSKNNPCVFDFTQEMEIDDTKELVYRSDLDAYASQQTEDYNNKKTEITDILNNKISEMDGKYNTFTSDANTTIVQYENEMDKRYENSIGALDTRESAHNTTLTNNLNSEISRAKSAESTLQSNIDTLTTNTTNNLNAYKEYVADGYSKVKVVDHLDKCTEDNIIYLVDPTWNNDYEVQTYEDREIKNLTHD